MRNDRSPSVAVLIPFYGPTEALRKTLVSLAEESLAHDVVVVDDGNVPPLALPSRCHPGVLVIRHRRNRGITAALNTGLDHILRSGYTYVARLDAGDRTLGERLQKQVDFLERNPACKLVGCHAVAVAEDGQPVARFTPPCTTDGIWRAMHRQCSLLHPTVLFRADVFAQVGRYRDKFPAAEDYDLFFRIATQFPTANLCEPLVEYEKGIPDSISSRRRRAQVMSRLRIVLGHFNPLLLESYLGVAEAMTCLALPFSVTLRMHRIREHLLRAAAE